MGTFGPQQDTERPGLFPGIISSVLTCASRPAVVPLNLTRLHMCTHTNTHLITATDKSYLKTAMYIRM